MIENSNISQRAGSHQLKNPKGYFERNYAEYVKRYGIILDGSFEEIYSALIGSNIQ